MSERESKAAKVDDLEKPITDQSAESVKGGAATTAATTAPTSPILVKQLNPRGIIPCV